MDPAISPNIFADMDGQLDETHGIAWKASDRACVQAEDTVDEGTSKGDTWDSLIDLLIPAKYETTNSL